MGEDATQPFSPCMQAAFGIRLAAAGTFVVPYSLDSHAARPRIVDLETPRRCDMHERKPPLLRHVWKALSHMASLTIPLSVSLHHSLSSLRARPVGFHQYSTCCRGSPDLPHSYPIGCQRDDPYRSAPPWRLGTEFGLKFPFQFRISVTGTSDQASEKYTPTY